MIDVIRSDYVRTARAKGLSEQKVIFKHVLKNALIPVVTLIGPIFAAVGTGSFFVEQVFGVPGMGKYYVQSMQVHDQTMILAVTLIYGVFLGRDESRGRHCLRAHRSADSILDDAARTIGRDGAPE